MLLPNEDVLYLNYVANYYSFLLSSEFNKFKNEIGFLPDIYKNDRYYQIKHKFHKAHLQSTQINKKWLKSKEHCNYRKNTDYGYRINLIKIENSIITSNPILSKIEFLELFKSKM